MTYRTDPDASDRPFFILGAGEFADLLIDRFYVGEPFRVHRDLPAEAVEAVPVLEVRSEGAACFYTEYAHIRDACPRGHDPRVVVADHWVQLSMARRIECQCGETAYLEIFGRPGEDYL